MIAAEPQAIDRSAIYPPVALWRRLLIVMFIRLGYIIGNIGIRLIPRDHPFRIFREKTIELLKDSSAVGLGSRRDFEVACVLAVAFFVIANACIIVVMVFGLDDIVAGHLTF